MGDTTFLFLAGLALFLGYVLVSISPLQDAQVLDLAAKRRGRKILVQYRHSKSELIADPNMKKRMRPAGGFVDESSHSSNWPRRAASLLKYKKHEWVLIGFQSSSSVVLRWENKGPDNSSVWIGLPYDQIQSLATQRNCEAVHVAHNHPNSDPAKYSACGPSRADLTSAQSLARVLNHNGIDLVEYVCE